MQQGKVKFTAPLKPKHHSSVKLKCLRQLTMLHNMTIMSKTQYCATTKHAADSQSARHMLQTVCCV